MAWFVRRKLLFIIAMTSPNHIKANKWNDDDDDEPNNNRKAVFVTVSNLLLEQCVRTKNDGNRIFYI